MSYDLDGMRNDAKEMYEQMLREIDLWERLDKHFSNSVQNETARIVITCEIRLWNEVSDLARHVEIMAKQYGYILRQINLEDDKFSMKFDRQ